MSSSSYRKSPQKSRNSNIRGRLNIMLKAHTENDAIGGAFVNWSSSSYASFLASMQPQIEWFADHGIPYDISCTYDFVVWAENKRVNGTPLLEWFLAMGCSLSTRAHSGGTKNGADAAWALNEQGITHNGNAGTVDDITDFVNEDGTLKDVAGTLHPEYTTQYDIGLGLSTGSHYGVDSFPCQVYRYLDGDFFVLNSGFNSYIDSIPLVAPYILNGTITSGLLGIMSNMSRLSDYATRLANQNLRPNAGPGDYMTTPIETHNGLSVGNNVTGGKYLKDELIRMLADLDQIDTTYKFVSPRQFVNDWIASGEPTIDFDVVDYSGV